MPQCTDAERKWLDAVRKGDESFEAVEDMRFHVALEKVGPEFQEQLARAFADVDKAMTRREQLLDKAHAAGFTPGNKGGISRLWEEADKKAKECP